MAQKILDFVRELNYNTQAQTFEYVLYSEKSRSPAERARLEIV